MRCVQAAGKILEQDPTVSLRLSPEYVRILCADRRIAGN